MGESEELERTEKRKGRRCEIRERKWRQEGGWKGRGTTEKRAGRDEVCIRGGRKERKGRERR